MNDGGETRHRDTGGETHNSVISGTIGTVVQARDITNRMAPVRPQLPYAVGSLPKAPAYFQDRAEVERLRRAVAGGGTAVLGQVLTGTGGVGKTYLAAHHARTAWESRDIDLLVWVTAATRDAVVTAYAQAAVYLFRAPAEEPAQAAELFLTRLSADSPRRRFPRFGPRGSSRPLRWLVVLDDVTEPGVLNSLWPPNSPYGRTIVTTRRRDDALTGPEHFHIPVGVFTEGESRAYLSRALTDRDRTEDPAELAALADDLGHLPLALSQAVAYLTDLALDIPAYRARLADPANRLPGLLPEAAHLPDQQRHTVATAWALSVSYADQLRPPGLARPLLDLLAQLDPNGIPTAVLTTAPARRHLAAARTDSAADGISDDDVHDALRALHRLSLVDHRAEGDGPDGLRDTVRVHQLLQRAVREQHPAGRRDTLARTAADALLAAWPDVERDAALAQALRANTDAVSGHAGEALLRPGAHPVLFRAGRSLGESGQAVQARERFRRLVHTLGPHHPDLFTARHHLAVWYGHAGDPARAMTDLALLLTHRQRALGPEHPDVLATRHDVAVWIGLAGDPDGAAEALSLLLPDRERVLHADHPDVLATRHEAAVWLARAEDPEAAAHQLALLLPHRRSVLGPDHPDVLTTRRDLAFCQGHAGDPARAAAALDALVPRFVDIFGADHLRTLRARHTLAYWRGQAGDAAGAAEACDALLDDQERVLGADHPDRLRTRHNLIHYRSIARGGSDAGADYNRLVKDQTRVLGADHPDTRRTRHLTSQGGVAGSATAYAELLPQHQNVLGPDHRDTFTARRRLAVSLGRAGYATGAAAALAGLLADQIRVLGPADPETLKVRDNLGLWQDRAGDPAGAADTYTELLRHLGRSREFTREDIITTRGNRARALGLSGRPADAARAYARILPLVERHFGPHHADTLITRHNLALFQGESGYPGKAVLAYDDLVPDLERVFGPDHPRTLTARHNLAHYWGRCGDPAGAVGAFAALVPDLVRVLGPDHPDTLVTRAALAHCRGEGGDPAAAAAGFALLLADRGRVLGAGHPLTLRTLGDLVRWRGEAGDAAGAADACADLLARHEVASGPDHPETVAVRGELARRRGVAERAGIRVQPRYRRPWRR